MSRSVTTVAKEKKAAKRKKGKQPEPKSNDAYPLAPKDQAWIDRKLGEYTALIGASMDAETAFAAKEKEWVAALKIGRQSARDRFRAGKRLMEIQAKITDEIGYPFWPWLKSKGVPEKTAQRAIELAKFCKTEDNLGDKTITECYAEMREAKAKTRVKDEENKEEKVKMGKDTDTVSKTLPNVTKQNGEEEPEAEEANLHLVKVDSFDLPETRPDHVYEVNKDKGSITRRKVTKQRGDKYYLGNGKSLFKQFGHPTWLGAYDSLNGALRMEVEEKEEEIEDLTEQKKKLVAELKNVEAQILGAIKEKEKLTERINKVEQLEPPKGAAAETEDEAA